MIGALHFYALAPLGGVNRSEGASPSNPKKLGIYVNPNPTFGADPLDGVGTLPRLERGCTVHVFRLGGNGTAGPGPIDPDFERSVEARKPEPHHGVVRRRDLSGELRRQAEQP